MQVIDSVLVEEFEEYPDVFQPGVKALAVEWKDGVRSVSNNHHIGAEVVGSTFDTDQRKMRVCGELLSKVVRGDQVRAHAREVVVEKLDQLFGRALQCRVM